MKNLSYVKLDNHKAKVICTCGWESSVFVQGPFDPNEALVASSIEHLKCNESLPAVYYAVAQEIHGKLRILCDLDSSPGAKERMEELAKGTAQKGMNKQVLEITVISSWIG